MAESEKIATPDPRGILTLRLGLLLGPAALIACPTLATVGYKFLIENLVKNQPSPTVSERFDALGLSDAYPFYQIVHSFLTKYSAYPTYSLEGSSFPNPFSLLSRIAVGVKPDDEIQLEKFVKGWGQKYESRKQLAKEKALWIKIELGSGVDDTETQVRNFYLKLADIFPYHVLISPDAVKIIGGGGYYDGKKWDWYGRTKPTSIGVESPKANLEGSIRSFMHELGHAEINWMDGKLYIPRDKFFEFNTILMQEVYKVFDYYFSLNWDGAITYREGIPLPLDRSPDFARLLDREDYLLKKYGVNVYQYGLPSNRQKDVYFRDSRILYVIVRHRLQILDKPEADRSQQEKQFLNDFDIYFIIKRGVDSLIHYFVGPIQRQKLGIPGTHYPLGFENEHLTQANARVQLARLRTFSNLAPKELTDIITASQAIRDRFNLDP